MTRELARRLTHAMNRIDAAYYINERGEGITDKEAAEAASVHRENPFIKPKTIEKKD